MPPLYLCVKARLCSRRAYFSIFPLLLFHARVTNERQRNECGGKALRTTKKETKKRRIWSRRGGENFRSQKRKKKSQKKKKKNDAFA